MLIWENSTSDFLLEGTLNVLSCLSILQTLISFHLCIIKMIFYLQFYFFSASLYYLKSEYGRKHLLLTC